MGYFTIKTEIQQLNRAYLVYIVEVSHDQKGSYFYVGQTGDRASITARSAIGRLSEHFNRKQSSNNQVYNQLSQKIRFSSSDKELKPSTIDEFLENSRIIMHTYVTNSFYEGISKSEHDQNRQFVEMVEMYLIQLMRKIYGEDRVLNNDNVFLQTYPKDERLLDIINEMIKKLPDVY